MTPPCAPDGDQSRDSFHDGADATGDRMRAAKRKRLELTVDSRGLVDEVAALLFAADPAGINFGSNTDEYLTEAEVIVIGLPATTGVQDVAELAQRVFTVWFDEVTAGPVDRYASVADGIWRAWRRHEGGSD